MRREIVRLGSISALAAAVGAGSWFAAAAVSDGGSGRPAAVDVEASLVTAAVERRVVVSALTGRATAGFADLVAVDAPGTGGRVTADPLREGSEVDEGDVLAEVDGRPVVALAGTTPMYRPLAIGASGPDVLAFEQALQRLGIDPGPVDGTFDEATARAVQPFYERIGYPVIEPTPEELAAYEAARSAVTQAELAVVADRHALDLDRRGLDPSQRAELDNAAETAREALARARRDRATLEADLQAEAEGADADLRQAQAAVADLRDQLRSLPSDATDAERAELGARVEAAEGAERTARAAVDGLARHRPGRLTDGDEAVRAAQRALDGALLARSDALTSKDRALLAQQLQVSEQAADDARARLAEQAIAVAAGVEAHEVVFVPGFPRRVQTVSVQRGDAVAGTLLTLSGGDPVGRWFVSDAERRQLEVAMPVTLAGPGGGERHEGSILSIADAPGDPSAAPGADPAEPGAGPAQVDGYLVELSIDPGGGIPLGSLVGRDLQVTVPIEESDGPQLAVPIAAVTSEPDGTTKVVVDSGGGRTRDVPVAVGLVGGGFAEVQPSTATSIEPGDRVVVGA